jgi:hypothetical protein
MAFVKCSHNAGDKCFRRPGGHLLQYRCVWCFRICRPIRQHEQHWLRSSKMATETSLQRVLNAYGAEIGQSVKRWLSYWLQEPPRLPPSVYKVCFTGITVATHLHAEVGTRLALTTKLSAPRGRELWCVAVRRGDMCPMVIFSWKRNEWRIL